jgi:hypothetical protein
MLTCFGNADCRDGYTCLDVSVDPARQIVDGNPVTRHICTVAPATTGDSGAPLPVSPQIPAVCLPPDASFSKWESDQSSDGAAEASSDGSAESAADGEDEPSSSDATTD